uniref:Transmembrane protein n=1 Tax=Chromera velia CCMP2878 TaxID=1169474 RepID=A0A0G4I6N6_9ALVE|eukprot:Cvel_11454.t1-p1 / transcript=Cvel_11454.t1 / gene=Cvel_11454 / organism=Chromera_velia_CCMP2878 / gene_product=hypothetical protein / transcript_product=hypothetical protein / location=Cvel_scaffold720:66130-68951(-) / protein_length=727 / sequence_SO=supercontig / SO=protein_coding / is_pseudo=false
MRLLLSRLSLLFLAAGTAAAHGQTLDSLTNPVLVKGRAVELMKECTVPASGRVERFVSGDVLKRHEAIAIPEVKMAGGQASIFNIRTRSVQISEISFLVPGGLPVVNSLFNETSAAAAAVGAETERSTAAAAEERKKEKSNRLPFSRNVLHGTASARPVDTRDKSGPGPLTSPSVASHLRRKGPKNPLDDLFGDLLDEEEDGEGAGNPVEGNSTSVEDPLGSFLGEGTGEEGVGEEGSEDWLFDVVSAEEIAAADAAVIAEEGGNPASSLSPSSSASTEEKVLFYPSDASTRIVINRLAVEAEFLFTFAPTGLGEMFEGTGSVSFSGPLVLDLGEEGIDNCDASGIGVRTDDIVLRPQEDTANALLSTFKPALTADASKTLQRLVCGHAVSLMAENNHEEGGEVEGGTSGFAINNQFFMRNLGLLCFVAGLIVGSGIGLLSCCLAGHSRALPKHGLLHSCFVRCPCWKRTRCGQRLCRPCASRVRAEEERGRSKGETESHTESLSPVGDGKTKESGNPVMKKKQIGKEKGNESRRQRPSLLTLFSAKTTMDFAQSRLEGDGQGSSNAVSGEGVGVRGGEAGVEEQPVERGPDDQSEHTLSAGCADVTLSVALSVEEGMETETEIEVDPPSLQLQSRQGHSQREERGRGTPESCSHRRMKTHAGGRGIKSSHLRSLTAGGTVHGLAPPRTGSAVLRLDCPHRRGEAELKEEEEGAVGGIGTERSVSIV